MNWILTENFLPGTQNTERILVSLNTGYVLYYHKNCPPLTGVWKDPETEEDTFVYKWAVISL